MNHRTHYYRIRRNIIHRTQYKVLRNMELQDTILFLRAQQIILRNMNIGRNLKFSGVTLVYETQYKVIVQYETVRLC